MQLVCIIPARGGSKGIPKKNLRLIANRPLVDWSILQAKESGLFSKILVTSDDIEILDRATKLGVEPVQRPNELASDTSPTEPAMLHAMKKVSLDANDIIALLQPTSPLRTPDDLKQAFTQFQSQNLDSLFSSSRAEDRFIWKTDGRTWRSTTYDWKNRRRRQDLEESYLENGSFYFSKAYILTETKNRLGGRIGSFVMPIWKAPQIDSPEDLEIVDLLMTHWLSKEWKPV